MHELQLFPAKEIVVSTNVPVRRDGLLLATFREPDDPAVAVYWVDADGPHVVACDQWRTVRENLRAVGLTISALRQLHRTGASQVLKRAYMGFAMLAASNPTRSWREVFGYRSDEKLLLAEVRKRYRELMLTRHPDTGGTDEEVKELNLAMESAFNELSL